MSDKQQAVRDRDAIDIEAMQRQLKTLAGDIPRMTSHYVSAVTEVDPHIFNYLMAAQSQMIQASQLLGNARLWLLTDGEEDV